MEAHPATVYEAISDAVPDRLALVQGDTRRTWRLFDDRAARLAGYLQTHDAGCDAKVGMLLYNCPEFLETYYAALKVRAVPFNVNYRYTADEVAYLLNNADTAALVYHSSLSDVVAGAIGRIGAVGQLIEVDDGGRHLPGAVAYEDALASASAAPRIERSRDDLTMIYTGGTTGMPKGVMGKVGPTIEYLLETAPPLFGYPPVPVDDVADFAKSLEEPGEWMVGLPAPPLMHNTGLGVGAAPALATGGTVVLLAGRRFDTKELWDTVERERVNAITIVGDPFARPMLAALDEGPARDLSFVRAVASSGAMFSAEVKEGLLRHMPQALILDIIGATEGVMGMSITMAGAPVKTATFIPAPGVIVVADDGRVVAPGSADTGLIALPGGAESYYKDEEKTAATFRLIDGKRYTIPGDYATVEADGTLTLLGRGSSTINTGGEKVFPEEVEEILKESAAVDDALVFGTKDERFGEKVVSVLSRSKGHDEPVETILDEARKKLASYKVPRAVVVVDQVPRTQVGKPDYQAARELFEAGRQEP
ncbi:MAG: AMP-binding protein [Acidimicrobiales bacterium]